MWSVTNLRTDLLLASSVILLFFFTAFVMEELLDLAVWQPCHIADLLTWHQVLTLGPEQNPEPYNRLCHIHDPLPQLLRVFKSAYR